jgi:hypothetical protein
MAVSPGQESTAPPRLLGEKVRMAGFFHSVHRSLCTLAAGGGAKTRQGLSAARRSAGPRGLYCGVADAVAGREIRLCRLIDGCTADLYTSPPLRAPIAGRWFELSFTSRLWDSPPRR